ncbi:MAG: molybdopterin-dependent oxidoreductase [Candidatus Nitrosocosmicus sp.]|nr:molybdopterin-dependent oxidoreductase [Candidatus Nitrosocosmicus sp.]
MAPRLRGSRYLSFFGFGIVAGLVAFALSIFFKISINGLFIPELASQGLISITSGEIESQAVLTLGPLAKYSTIIGASVVNILLYGIIGIISGVIFDRLKINKYIIRTGVSTLFSYLILVVIVVIFVILSTVPGQPVLIPYSQMAKFILPNVGFGLIISFLLLGKRSGKSVSASPLSKKGRQIEEDEEKKIESKANENQPIDYNKRDMIKALIISAIALPLIYLGFNRLLHSSDQQQQQQSGSQLSRQAQNNVTQQILQSKTKPAGFEDPRLTPLLDAEITPTYLFYRIDINAIVPVVNAQDWNLSIKGLVDNPIAVNYEEIKNMNPVEQFSTLVCVSNKIGGNLTSTALWKGIHLRDLLSKAGVKPNVKYIVFRCSDGYDVGIPFENGMMDGTILAYDMNKAPLTSEHGYPIRAIVPGFYGMMNPKWITEIELVDKTYEGFWQRKGWTNDPIKNIYSSIVVPGNQPITDRFPHTVADTSFAVGKNIPIAGIAFSGDKGISKVEVSTDGGKTWKTAVVKDPLSQYTWVLWTSRFSPEDKGTYDIVVRATDKTGQTQTSKLEDPFPSGAGGYDHIDVSV